jgi:hypothetical protein
MCSSQASTQAALITALPDVLPLRRFRAQIRRMRLDAHAPQIQPVGVPAGQHGDITLGVSVAVMATCGLQQREARVVQFEQIATQARREFRAALAVLRVPTIRPAACVVKDGKQFDHMDVRAGFPRQQQAVPAHAAPVAYAVDAPEVEPETAFEFGEQAAAEDGAGIPWHLISLIHA